MINERTNDARSCIRIVDLNLPWEISSRQTRGPLGIGIAEPGITRKKNIQWLNSFAVLKWIGKGAREKGFRGTAKEGGSEDESFEWSGSNSSSLHYLLNLLKLLRVGETIVCEGEGRWTLSRRLVESPMDHG